MSARIYHDLLRSTLPALLLATGCAAAPPSLVHRDCTVGNIASDSERALPDISPIEAEAAQGNGAVNPRPSRATLEPANPAWMGIELKAMPSHLPGLRIVDVLRESPAATAGLCEGDVILTLNSACVGSVSEFVQKVRRAAVGSTLTLEVERRGARRVVTVDLKPAPPPEQLLELRFVGKPAPALEGLSLITRDGVTDWVALRGHVVVLEFWSPWCGACRLLHRRMNEWQTQWAKYPVQILGIVALSPEDAAQSAQRSELHYAVAADPEETTFHAYDVFAVPSLFLIDKQGLVVDAVTGYFPERISRIERRLIALLGEP